MRARRRASRCRRRARRRSRRGGPARRRRAARDPGGKSARRRSRGRGTISPLASTSAVGEVARGVSAGREALDLQRGPVERDRGAGFERPPLDAGVLGQDPQHGVAVGERVPDLPRCRRRAAAPRTRAGAAGPPCGRSPRRSAARRPPARRARRDLPASGSSSSCWRRSGDALPRNHGPRSPRIAIEDCVRGTAPPERAASHVGQRQFHCGKPPPAAEPRIRTRTTDRSTGLDVAVTPSQPAEVEADVLAVAADGALMRELDARFGGRLARAAADADPLATLDAGASAASRSPPSRSASHDAEGLRTRRPRECARPRRGTVAWALEAGEGGMGGAGARRGRRARRL